MRAPLVSSPGRAATYLCVACRREAIAALATQGAASRIAATVPSQRTIRTISSSQARRAAGQRWASASQSRGASTNFASAPAGTATSEPASATSPIPTYYALFPETLPNGPPPQGKFHIDLRALRREFLRLQAASHPDFHHHAAASSSSSPSTAEQPSSSSSSKSPARIRAEATSALINAAYKTLSSPLLRAQYLLREQHGIDLEGDEAGAEAAPDPELLMTVLEAREAIEEAEREEDLEEVRAANEERIRESEARLAEALETGDVQAAKEEAVRLRYWVNIREGVDNWERGKPVVLHH
ncbi:HSCB C-terminal oligomerization domain-containing protein [Achaetomium macrosporum]|uniref:HSCB C-terminal oligomerization domain-containing protein n=1 Tax=Achaetomium macrosporum TaxID=79813 RepID=A0AAN7CEW6_9PEZI|nr:HSCB C-terminal oligomerization domain-containing protein [Achaetomium macrosporum]